MKLSRLAATANSRNPFEKIHTFPSQRSTGGRCVKLVRQGIKRRGLWREIRRQKVRIDGMKLTLSGRLDGNGQLPDGCLAMNGVLVRCLRSSTPVAQWVHFRNPEGAQ